MENERGNAKGIGKYTVLKPLGQGGEGCVYLARDEILQRLVAIKQMHECHRSDAEDTKQGEHVHILQEADFLQHLKHPMLPVVYDLVWDGAWYLVMEYIQGVTLQEYIGQNGYVGEETACAWAGQLLDILEYLHTRKPPIVYRDLKPDNIMVCPDGHLKLVDFGAADRRKFGSGGTDRMAATPGYGAPEQFGGVEYASHGRKVERMKRGPEQKMEKMLYGNIQLEGRTGSPGREAYADERSDIFAFGKVLYYMVTGADPAKPPYTKLSVCDYQPLLHNRLEGVIRRCTREDPAQRYQVAEEIRKDLNRCGKRNRRLRRRSFVRMVEKRVWLTER